MRLVRWSTSVRRGAAIVVAVASIALLGACGGGSGSDGGSTPAPASPGANVDPNAHGVVGGPINRAKDVAEDAESRDAQVEQQGSTTEP